MALLPAKFEWAIPQTLNTYAVKDQLKALGFRYGESRQTGDVTWYADSEALWRKGMEIAQAAGEAKRSSSRGFQTEAQRRSRYDNYTGVRPYDTRHPHYYSSGQYDADS